jgi:hypothetical protein
MPSFSAASNTNGVKYIKINKTSSNGLDRTAYLEQLQSINIRFEDVGVVEYQIVSAQQFDEYYLFGINDDPTLVNQYGIPQYPISSSTDNEIKDYHLDARKSYTTDFLISSSFNPINPSSTPIRITDYSSIPTDEQNYFNSSSGRYTLGNTPNIVTNKFCYTASFWIRGNGSPYTYVNIHPIVLLTRGGSTSYTSGVIDPITVNFSNIINGNELNIIYSGSITSSAVFNNLLEGDTLSLGIFTSQPLLLPGGSDVYLFKQLKFEISQSIPPTSSTQITAFNPDEVNFYYSDYNALYGNALLPEYSQYKMEADYNNQSTPVNFTQLIEGTALRANIQDSNYASKAWSTIRYDGSIYSSISSPLNNGFNSPASLPVLNNLDTGYGNLPAAEQNETYFAYFDGVGGTGPEIIDQTAYNIKYIIDDEGNTVNPESILNPFSKAQQNIALNNLIDAFEPGKNAMVSLISNDPLLTENPNDDALVGTYPITHVGRIANILVSENGELKPNYIPTMSFTNIAGIPYGQALYNYEFLDDKASDTSYSGTTSNYVVFNDITIPNPSFYTPATSIFTTSTISTAGALTKVKFKAKLMVKYRPTILGGSDIQRAAPLRVRIKNVTTGETLASQTINFGDGVGDWSSYKAIPGEIQFYWEPDNPLAGTTEASPDGGIIYLADDVDDGNAPGYNRRYYKRYGKFELETNYVELATNNNIRVEIIALDYGNTNDYTVFSALNINRSQFKSIQEFPYAAYEATSSYWYTGSTSIDPLGLSVLTSSLELGNLYNFGITDDGNSSELVQTIDPSSQLMGYTPTALPFCIKSGDYIRFEYNPNAVFNIKRVEVSNQIYLYVYPPVPNGVQLNHFNIYRIINDGTYIVLNVKKPISGSSFTGIIRPQFTSQKLIDSSSIYIQNLVEKGVIS